MNSIRVVVVMSILSCAACNDRAASGSKSQDRAAAVAPTVDNILPAPTAPLTLPGEDPKTNRGPATLENLMREMERITPARFVVNAEGMATLGRVPIGNLQAIVVPAEKAWSVFESILCEHEFFMGFVSSTEPIMLSVNSMMGRGGRGGAKVNTIEVPVADVPRWRAHPAFMITTTIELNSVNVRDLSNSMRQMFTDPNSQQIVPIGNSNSLMITGISGSVVPLVKMLQGIDASERERQERKALAEEAQREKADKSASPK